jgi:hypothetical protein
MRTFLILIAAGLVLMGIDRARSQETASAGPGDSRNFVEYMECAPDGVAVTFAIPGRTELDARFGRLPDEIWIDISLFNNNFVRGTFLGAGPFVPQSEAAAFFRWQGVDIARAHWYRLNARFGGSWTEVGRGAFETPNCGPVRFVGCDAVSGDTPANHVRFAIAPASPIPPRSPREQWLDLTLRASPLNPMLDDGFPPGTFIGAGPFPSTGAGFEWDGILPGLRHYYRQTTRYFLRVTDPDVWVTQFSGSFVSLDCRDRPFRRPPAI